MKNSIRALWEENGFYVLGIMPSAGTEEIRRAIDQARLEVTMGIRGLSEQDLEAVSSALRSDDSRFEMRLFAEWHGDPLFGPWADRHDAIVGEFLHPNVATRASAVLAAWFALLDTPRLADALQSLAPPNEPLGDVWGSVAVELLRAGFRRGEPPVAFIEAVAEPSAANPARIIAEVVSETVQAVDGVVRDTRGQMAPDGAVPKANARALAAAFIKAAANALAVCEALEKRAVRGASVRDGVERILEQIRSASIQVSTALHNGGSFSLANDVLLKALEFPLSPADENELDADLRIVRKVWGQERFANGMESRNYAEALIGLDLVIENTDDEAERAQATAMLPRVEKAEEESRRGPIRRLWRRGTGLLGSAAVIGGIVFIRVLAANDDTGGAAASSAREPAATATPPREPTVGDCIKTTGAGLGVSVRVVSCQSANDGRVLRVAYLTGSTYPSDAALQRQADSKCPAATEHYLFPLKDNWAAGDRELLCLTN